jgi:hypothetical protein
MRILRLPVGYGWDDPVRAGETRDNWASPREWFAEGYALCAVGERPDGYAYGYGYRPTVRQQRRVCGLIRRAGGWAMRPAGL